MKLFRGALAVLTPVALIAACAAPATAPPSANGVASLRVQDVTPTVQPNAEQPEAIGQVGQEGRVGEERRGGRVGGGRRGEIGGGRQGEIGGGRQGEIGGGRQGEIGGGRQGEIGGGRQGEIGGGRRGVWPPSWWGQRTWWWSGAVPVWWGSATLVPNQFILVNGYYYPYVIYGGQIYPDYSQPHMLINGIFVAVYNVQPILPGQVTVPIPVGQGQGQIVIVQPNQILEEPAQ